MANYKGHLVGGFLAAAAYAAAIIVVPLDTLTHIAGLLQGWQAVAAVFVVAMLFALFPDIDTNSKAQNIFLGSAFVIDILLIVSGEIQAAAYLGLLAMTPIVGKHRGWTHSKIAMLAVPLPILVVPYLYNPAILPLAFLYYGAAVAGYFSHLFLDGLIIRRFKIQN